MIMGVVRVWFYFWGVARALDLVVPEAISKKLEPMCKGSLRNILNRAAIFFMLSLQNDKYIRYLSDANSEESSLRIILCTRVHA